MKNLFWVILNITNLLVIIEKYKLERLVKIYNIIEKYNMS